MIGNSFAFQRNRHFIILGRTAHMRTLKYAILGLINREPMTGYDITREFNSNNLANFWYAKHSQVYPELGRLMDEKLVTCTRWKGAASGMAHEKRTAGANPERCLPPAYVLL